MMLGPEGAGERARAWLADRLPANLRRLETALALDVKSLPDPVQVLAQETGPLALEQWPAVYVLPRGTTALDLVDVLPDAAEVYRVTYNVRVLLWVRADSYGTTDQLRKRYVLATRTALLERKTLTTATAYAATTVGDVTVDPSSIREDYSDVMTDEAGRTIAGAYLDVLLTAVEVLPGPTTLGSADELTVDEAPLPAHPGLD